MRDNLRSLLLCLALLLLIPGLANAQVSLATPPDGAELSSPPQFSWTAGSYDAFVFLSIFYYEVEGWAGYYPVYFWLLDTGFAMPSSWWDKIASDTTCYWAVFGYNTDTQQGGWSSVATFTTTGCTGQCVGGGYTFDCNPDAPCICFTTTEGAGACIDDFWCDSAEPCSTSADCPGGKVCITCSNCGGNFCAANQCTDGGPYSTTTLSNGNDGGLLASGAAK